MGRALFVDRPTPWSFLAAVGRRHAATTLLAFETAGGIGPALFALAARLGILPRLGYVDVSYADLRSRGGASGYIQVLRDTRVVCARYREERIVSDPIVRALSRTWPIDAIALHFERRAELELRWEVLRVDMALALAAEREVTETTLVVRGRAWSPQLRAHARARGVDLVWYHDVGGRALRRAGAILTARVRPRAVAESAAAARAPAPPAGPTLALQYGHRTLDAGPGVRSELFWLDGLSPQDCSVAVVGAGAHLSDADRVALERSGVSRVDAAVETRWDPTFAVIAGAIAAQVVRMRLPRSDVVRGALRLAGEYARWRAAFRRHGVHLLVAPLSSDVSVGQTLAMHSLGGVVATYQLSISNMVAPSSLLASGADVQFSFADRFAAIWDGVAWPPRAHVAIGFVYGGAAATAAVRERAARTRDRLARGGASWIATFFDENSVDGWNSPFTHRDAARDYEFLLRWLIEDGTMGLVVKPKKSVDLRQRVRPVTELLASAERTGRCVVLEGKHIVGEVYPAEAALAADICIAKLAGATAGLEAQLAGRPAVLVDAEGFRDHPLYTLGRGTVVFEDWISLRSAVEVRIQDAVRHKAIGDWSAMIDELDPFRDGRAAERMRTHLFAACQALARGASPADAVRAGAAAMARLSPELRRS